eukprot:jgi/Galph1/5315/GphlegSOOS_G3991.1
MLEWLVLIYLLLMFWLFRMPQTAEGAVLGVATRKFILSIALVPSSCVLSLENSHRLCDWLGYSSAVKCSFLCCYSLAYWYVGLWLCLFVYLCFYVYNNILFPSSRYIRFQRAIESVYSKTNPVESSTVIQLMTYNAFCRPPGIAGDEGEDYKDERLELLLTRLSKLDVICFQELFDAFCNRRQAFLEAAKRLGFQYYCFLPRNLLGMFPPRVIDGGVTILSKWPIVYTNYWHYRHCVYSTVDSFVGKGCLYARISLVDWLSLSKENHQGMTKDNHVVVSSESKYLHVFSTHMQAGDRPGYQHESYHARIRVGQLEEMRDFIHWQIAQDDGPILITGDFNINARASMEDDSDSFWYEDLMERLQDCPSAKILPKLQEKRRRAMKEEKIENLHLVDWLSLSYNGRHPITDGTKCIDYLLFDPRKGPLDIMNQEEICKTMVDPFVISLQEKQHCPQDMPATLSDHYAIIGKLMKKENP